jgi:long-chain acyl-CoA synthetase
MVHGGLTMNRVDPLLDWAVGLPGKVAIEFEGRATTFAELADRVESAAAELAGQVRRGDTIGLFLENTPDFVVAEYACFWLGASVCPLNRLLTDSELAEACGRLGVRLLLSDGWHGSAPTNSVMSVPQASGVSAPPPLRMGPDDGCFVLQTSGSTGRPKGVQLTYRNVRANYDRTYRWLGVTGADVLLQTLPLYNTYGLNQGINLMATTGATMLLHRRFSPEQVLRSLRDDGPTFFPAVPTMITRLHDQADEPITKRRVKVGVGAAPTPREVVKDVWDILPGAEIFLGYGLTEATALVTVVHVGGTDRATATELDNCGRPVPGVDLKIDGPDATGLGEVLVRGDLVFDSYVGSDEKRPVEDGWLRTGDLGRLIGGSLAIADRKRDLIIRGGQNVYPGEIERVLHQHASVLEAAVVGRANPDLGEVPVAYVVLRAGFVPGTEELRAHCARHLAGFKQPITIEILEELPRGSTGKISKQQLRDLDSRRPLAPSY